MIEIKQVYNFATKWLNEFKNPVVSYKKLISHHMGDECSKLGFQVYCGHTFFEKYGKINDPKTFKEILKNITDINLLGSAIYSKWNYFSSWAYNDSEILEDRNREWFILALEHLVKLSEDKPYGNIKKIKIISNKIFSEHYTVKPEDEIQQFLKIESDGHIWFSAYTSEKRKDGKYKKNRMNNFRIDSSIAEKIIHDISSCFDIKLIPTFEEIKYPKWTMEIINDKGKIYKLCDSPFFIIDDVDYDEYISNRIRRALKMPDLFLFDGKLEEDVIDKIVVDYHRVTKINTKRAFDKEKSPFDWNYIEKLIVDRKAKTIEHIQDIGLGCTVSKKYTSQNAIDDILDDLNIYSLLKKDEPEIRDFELILPPEEKREYIMTITFKNGGEKTISGTYDKKGLPYGWEDFAEAIFDFVSFYGCGEILNPAVYEKDYDDIILCHVKFKEGNKTYSYISDIDNIEVGDWVVIPVGDSNYETIGEVVKIEYLPEEQLPFPMEKTKHIIKKCSKK